MRLDELSFDERGLLPAVVQDSATGDVLMLAWVDEEALRRTMQTGTTWFWSRSRREYWNKGATSGNVQSLDAIFYDCDADAVLMRVTAAGPACHTGERSCFYRELPAGGNVEGT